MQAGEIAIKFLEPERAAEVASVAGPRLVQIGRYSAAAQLYLATEMIKEAVDAFIAGEEWSKAGKVARELEPRLESYVDEKYKHFLKSAGRADVLTNVDLTSALDLYVEQGNWGKAVSTAAEHGPELLHKYLAMQATHLIKEQQPAAALQLYREHGAPNYRANYNIYKRIGVDLFGSRSLDTEEAYTTWAALRDLYLQVGARLVIAGMWSAGYIADN